MAEVIDGNAIDFFWSKIDMAQAVKVCRSCEAFHVAFLHWRLRRSGNSLVRYCAGSGLLYCTVCYRGALDTVRPISVAICVGEVDDTNLISNWYSRIKLLVKSIICHKMWYTSRPTAPAFHWKKVTCVHYNQISISSGVAQSDNLLPLNSKIALLTVRECSFGAS